MPAQMGVGLTAATGIQAPFGPMSLIGLIGDWDFGDPTTVFTDLAGTEPVSGSKSPVRLVKDKSGRGNHLTSAAGGAEHWPNQLHGYGAANFFQDRDCALTRTSGVTGFGSLPGSTVFVVLTGCDVASQWGMFFSCTVAATNPWSTQNGFYIGMTGASQFLLDWREDINGFAPLVPAVAEGLVTAYLEPASQSSGIRAAGGSATDNSTAGSGTMSPTMIAVGGRPDAATNNPTASIVRVLVYNRKLAAAEIGQMQEWLRVKYGVS